jgi:DNA-directed RNA polymerase subunit L
MTSSIHSDIPSLSYASDMRILMENMQALNVNHRHDDHTLVNSMSLKESDPRLTGTRQYVSHPYRSILSQSFSTESSDVSQ